MIDDVDAALGRVKEFAFGKTGRCAVDDLRILVSEVERQTADLAYAWERGRGDALHTIEMDLFVEAPFQAELDTANAAKQAIQALLVLLIIGV